MNHANLFKTAIGVALALQIPASAGTTEAPVVAPAESNPGDWCTWLQDKPGTIYKNKDNPFLQLLQVGGRLQWQTAYLDGEDVTGRDFNDTYEEFRRVRIETKVELLKYFTANVKLNMVDDQRPFDGSLGWGYEDFDEAVFSFDIKKAFGAGPMDELKLNYGRFKFNMSEEVHMSSKEIYTIERSAMANKVYGANSRPTGVTVDGKLGDWSGTVGVFSGEDDSEFIGGWNDGQAYYLSVANQFNDSWRFIVDYAQNAQAGDDDFLGYEWATTFNAVYEEDRFGTMATLIIGENNSSTVGRGGNFQSIMVMPWYWIIEKRLQAVLQYQYAGASEDEGIRTNKRYVRGEHSPGVNVNSGYGDQLQTLYAGLNYLICGDNLKIMGGIELSGLDTAIGDVDTVTYLFGFRTFF